MLDCLSGFTVTRITTNLQQSFSVRDSGRSHTIFTLIYRREEVFDQDEEAATKSFRTIAGRLDFVDLAGVNRVRCLSATIQNFFSVRVKSKNFH